MIVGSGRSRSICVLLGLLAGSACSSVFTGEDTYAKADRVQVGATVQELVQAAGAPGRRSDNVSPDCRHAGGVEAMVFEVSVHLPGGFMKRPSHNVVFCLDRDARVVLKKHFEF